MFPPRRGVRLKTYPQFRPCFDNFKVVNVEAHRLILGQTLDFRYH